MHENDSSTSGERPESKKLDKKTLLIVATFVSGLVLLVALNMK